jgi:deoxycytidine triphosphate deaminase
VDLEKTRIGDVEAVAFCAQKEKDNEPIPLWKGDVLTDPRKHWRLVETDGKGRLKIENDRFYILRSKEKIRVPLGIAIYCRASDETLGEMRIHYAGFVHPGFGERTDGDGTPLIFEVRGHQVDVNLRDGERLANLVLYRMSENAKAENSDYGKQTLKLSGFFSEWSKGEVKDGAIEAAKETAEG